MKADYIVVDELYYERLLTEAKRMRTIKAFVGMGIASSLVWFFAASGNVSLLENLLACIAFACFLDVLVEDEEEMLYRVGLDYEEYLENTLFSFPNTIFKGTDYGNQV